MFACIPNSLFLRLIDLGKYKNNATLFEDGSLACSVSAPWPGSSYHLTRYAI